MATFVTKLIAIDRAIFYLVERLPIFLSSYTRQCCF